MVSDTTVKALVLTASYLLIGVLAIALALVLPIQSASADRNSASVTLSAAVTFPSGGYIAQGIAIADLRGHGKADIVVADWWDPSTLQGVVGVLLQKADGGFQPVVTYETGGAPGYGLAVADVNGDRIPDIVVISCAPTASTCDSVDGVVSVLLGNGDGTFKPAVTYDAGAVHTAGISIADVNGDGKPDLLVANYVGESNGDGTVAVLLGNGDGTFQPARLFDSGAQNANDVIAADVNGDGVPDLLVANRCDSCGGGWLGVMLGNGDGTFQPAVTYATGGSNSGWLAVRDLNGDGKPDVIVSSLNLFMQEGLISVLLGRGDGTFGPPTTYGSGGYAATELILADVNGDRKPDIVVANCGPVGGCGTGQVGVLLGQGNGTFRQVVTFSSGAYNATTIAVGNVNKGKMPDVVVANQCEASNCSLGSVGLLLNQTKK